MSKRAATSKPLESNGKDGLVCTDALSSNTRACWASVSVKTFRCCFVQKTFAASIIARSITWRVPPAAAVSAATLSAVAESGSGSTHFTRTLVSISQSFMATAVRGDFRRAVRQDAMLCHQLLLESLHDVEPRAGAVVVGRFDGKPNTL